MSTAPPFRYESFRLEPARGLLSCRYSLGDRRFEERVTFDPDGRWDDPATAEAARLVFLLAGVSYYKTAAPPVVDLGETAVTDAERRFLHAFYVDGLGEFAYRNDLDLTGLRIEGPVRPSEPGPGPGTAGPGAVRPGTVRPGTAGPGAVRPGAARPVAPLVPFGGGIDSIVTVEHVRRQAGADTALFIMSRPGARFDAIEAPAAVTGLPIVRAGREIDPQLLRSRELGFRNGHVPVTGVLSAIAVMAAVLDGRDAVVMSNEWSASVPTMEVDGRPVNHQYSKSATFEAAFRAVLVGALGGRVDYFSALRPFSELWVAQRFAGLTQYHRTFRSCNRAFHLDPAHRLDHWCGQCDKCCFIDLILAPFLSAAELSQIFDGREPLADPDGSLEPKFRALLGTLPDSKPFECVGEVGECRAAALLAAQRPDRTDPAGTDPAGADAAGTSLLQRLAAEVAVLPDQPDAAQLLRPIGEHFIPDSYAPQDLLV